MWADKTSTNWPFSATKIPGCMLLTIYVRFIRELCTWVDVLKASVEASFTLNYVLLCISQW